MKILWTRVLLIIATALLMLTVAVAQKGDPLEVQLKDAIHKETIDGDLKGAIAQYRKIIDTRNASRSVVARALLQLGTCYEKQGDAEARKVFERLTKDFADQADVVVKARARLNTIASPAMASGSSGLSLRRLNVDPSDWYSTGPPPLMGAIWYTWIGTRILRFAIWLRGPATN